MSSKRTWVCNGCGVEKTESKFNKGFTGWGMLQGLLSSEGEEGVHLCPTCLMRAALAVGVIVGSTVQGHECDGVNSKPLDFSTGGN